MVKVPDLELRPDRVDFGLEYLLADDQLRVLGTELLGATSPLLSSGNERGVIVRRDESGPIEVSNTEKDSRVWKSLIQHLSKRDGLWRGLKDWEDALVVELKARAKLNQKIVEILQGKFKLQVLFADSKAEPHFTHEMPQFVRVIATMRALGWSTNEIERRLVHADKELRDQYTSRTLASNIDNGEELRQEVLSLVGSKSTTDEGAGAAVYNSVLRAKTAKVQDVLEEYELLHYVRGTCSMCKKLGGL